MIPDPPDSPPLDSPPIDLAPPTTEPPTASAAAPEPAPLPFTVRRPVAKVGRNDPCPCGSGKKYKKCCLEKDRERLADPSPYAGLTMAEAKRDPASHGDPTIFFEMTREELLSRDRSSLPTPLLDGLAAALGQHEAFAEASAVIDELAARADLDDPLHVLDLRDELVYRALAAGAIDFARAEADRRGDEQPTMSSQLNRLALELQGELPHPIAVLESFSRQVLDDGLVLHDLADTLSLAGLPGIALVLARAAALVPGRAEDRASLGDLIAEERERLGLDPHDPAITLLDKGGRLPRHKRPGAADVAALEARLVERDSAIQKMRAERDRLAGELETRRLSEEVAAATSAAPVESDDARRLRRQVEKLQAELRGKQEERLELQRKLRATMAGEAPEGTRGVGRASGGAVHEPLDLDEGVAVPEDQAAPLRPVRFTDAFYESAATLDDGKLMLRAQEAAVRFAALDPATWKQAKKMQDLDGVYTLRVGIHHRLFVTRPDDKGGSVHVRELVTRESFDRALKRYRR